MTLTTACHTASLALEVTSLDHVTMATLSQSSRGLCVIATLRLEIFIPLLTHAVSSAGSYYWMLAFAPYFFGWLVGSLGLLLLTVAVQRTKEWIEDFFSASWEGMMTVW